MILSEDDRLMVVPEDYKVIKNLINYTLNLIKENSNVLKITDSDITQRYIELKIKELVLMFYPPEVFEQLNVEYSNGKIKVNCKLMEYCEIIEEASNRERMEFSMVLDLGNSIDIVDKGTTL